MFRLVLIITSIIFFCKTVSAQKVSAETDRNKILIGEQAILQLKAEDINDRTTLLQNWFAFNDTTGHIHIVKREPVDTIEINGLTTYFQKITLTSFDSGNWKIAPLPVIIQDRITGKKTFLLTDSVLLEVLPVDVSSMQTYHPIKEIIDVDVPADYWLYARILAGLIAAAIITWLAIKYLKKKKQAPSPTHKGTALEHALQQIKLLVAEALPAKGQAKLFYADLVNICKDYFSEELKIRSTQSTSDELMVLLSVYLQEQARRTQFFQLLRLSDAVKFAKYIPGEEQDKHAVETAVISLKHIDALMQQIKNNA